MTRADTDKGKSFYRIKRPTTHTMMRGTNVSKEKVREENEEKRELVREQERRGGRASKSASMSLSSPEKV